MSWGDFSISWSKTQTKGKFYGGVKLYAIGKRSGYRVVIPIYFITTIISLLLAMNLPGAIPHGIPMH